MREMLCFDQVSLTYQAENGEVEALRDISFCVREGELVAIVGPSGCGKSTLLSLASGLTMPTAGQICVAGTPVTGVSGKTGYMLQKDNLLDWRTIRANTMLGLEIRGIAVNRDYADELLHTYGLWDFRDKHPAQLSGGMRQRVALIRTLAPKPELLLLDESFSALDYQTRLAVADDVHSILKREQKTAVIVTHDISEAISMADRLIVLSKRPGRIRHQLTIAFGASEPDGTCHVPPLKRRDDPLFRAYFNEIWKELDVHV